MAVHKGQKSAYISELVNTDDSPCVGPHHCLNLSSTQY